MEQVVGRNVVERASGNVGGPVQKVHTSEIMKSFRCKEDFIKILTIEGKYLAAVIYLSAASGSLLFLQGNTTFHQAQSAPLNSSEISAVARRR
jgi:hypothetical protein